MNKKLKISYKTTYSSIANGSGCCSATGCQSWSIGGMSYKTPFKDRGEGFYVSKKAQKN